MTDELHPDRFIAQFKMARQISEDEWEICSPTLIVTKNTTMGEIMQWATDKAKRIDEIKIIKADQL